MTNNQNQPNQYDAVLGGNSPPPIHGAVLGGIEGVKRRLASSNVDVQISALNDALNYGDVGFNLLIDTLEHESRQLQRMVADFLKNLGGKKARLALDKYKFWHSFDKYYEIPCDYANRFANRKIIEFDPEIGIDTTADNAYALRVGGNKQTENMKKLQIFLQNPLINQVEALVLGHWYTNHLDIIDLLLDAQNKLTNLKALFIGDSNYLKHNKFYVISKHYDISYILLVYQQIEILHFRCTNCHRKSKNIFTLSISPIKHEKLKALIIECCSNNNFIDEFYHLELPALEYLELRISQIRYNHREDYDIYKARLNKFMTAINNNFPKLKYLGLRNNYDELTFALINSPIIGKLVELNISTGEITDIAAEALFNCPAIRQLDTLDISYNWINYEMRQKMNLLDINFICESDKPEDYRFWPANE